MIEELQVAAATGAPFDDGRVVGIPAGVRLEPGDPPVRHVGRQTAQVAAKAAVRLLCPPIRTCSVLFPFAVSCVDRFAFKMKTEAAARSPDTRTRVPGRTGSTSKQS